MSKIDELDDLVNSFELQELEERIELGCLSGNTSGSGTVGSVWSF